MYIHSKNAVHKKNLMHSYSNFVHILNSFFLDGNKATFKEQIVSFKNSLNKCFCAKHWSTYR